ncbi:hypothetical protein JRQ81_004957 [Phrynocephalus forsythii]|uniref:Uncharacterized protein n=1 Tax=Phrynocephalus forsythii TaxID=171643 RepID=A0A9Q0Y2G3_9SAUR|nr:hypothetical protein JRQ81_004957 [Phrynocephalus forsythii]
MHSVTQQVIQASIELDEWVVFSTSRALDKASVCLPEVGSGKERRCPPEGRGRRKRREEVMVKPAET